MGVVKLSDYRPPLEVVERRVADTDDGFIMLAMELYEELIGANLTKNQAKVAHAVCRKTYGYKKKMDRIADSQLASLCHISREKVCTARNELIEMRVILSDGRKIGPNKNISEWVIPVSTRIGNIVTKKDTITVTESVTPSVTKLDTHKRNTLKIKDKTPHTPQGDISLLAQECVDYYNELTSSKCSSTAPYEKALSTVKAKGVCYTVDEVKLVTHWAVSVWKHKPSINNLCRMTRFDAYLSDALKWEEGTDRNPVLALAAYNAGPGKVDQWIKQIGDPRKGEVSDEGFANSIPYGETQNYVASVMSNAAKVNVTKNVIDSPEFGMLDAQQKARAVEQTYNVIDTATSSQRFSIQQRMQDDMARINAGKEVETPVTASEYVAAQQLSSTPAQRAQAYQQFDQYRQVLALQPAYKTIISSPSNVGLDAVNALRPDASDADFEFKQKRYAMAVQKYQQTIAAREKDPGGWMVQNVPSVQQAYQTYQQDPTTGSQLAHQILMEKQRLGIKSKDVLPDSIASGILQQINNNKEQDVNAIQSLGQQFGPYSEQVMQQIQKKSGPVLQVIMATNNPRAANALWQNRDVKTSELKDAVNTASKGASDSADSEWGSQSKDFASTMVGQPGGIAIWNNFNEQGRRLTYLNMQKGMGASDAAAQAYQDILGSQYQTKGTWRIPVTANADINDVSDGVDAFMDKLKPSDITPLNGDPRLGDDVNRKQSLDRIKDNGEWVTNSDETGLMLTLNGLVVNDAQGNPLTVKFADLAQLGSANRGVLNQLSKDAFKPKIYTPGQSVKESQNRNEETARQLGNFGSADIPSMAEGMRNTNANLYQRSGAGD